MRLALICLLALVSSSFAQLRVTSSVDKNPVRMGDSFSLTVQVDGAVTGVSTPTLPPLVKVQITGGPFTSTNVSIINGRSSSSLTYTYRMRALQDGDGEIGSISVVHDGKPYTTAPIRLKILPSGSQVTGQAQQGGGGNANANAQSEAAGYGDNVFIRAVPDKSEVVQGEQVTIAYKIYFNVQITSPEITQLPRAAGFWVKEIPTPNTLALTDEIVNGKTYKAAVLRKFAMFPTTTGELDIEPLELSTQVQRQRQSSRDPFDIFNDPFFRLGAPREQINISSPRVKIKVTGLPAGAPAGFSGAVGNYKLSATLDRNVAKTNDAVTLTVRIEGMGNIKTLPEPAISFPPDFDRYDPKQDEQISRSQGKISGAKIFEYVLIPRAPGEQRIPEINYPFFDPATNRYETVTSQPLVLNVERGEGIRGSGQGEQVQRRDVTSVGTDITFAKTRPGEFHPVGSSPHHEVGFWILTAGPWALLAAIVLFARRKTAAAARIPLRTRAVKDAHKQLLLAQKASAKAAHLDACKHVAVAISTLLGTAAPESADGTDVVSVRENWSAAGNDPELLESILDLQRDCNMVRFAISSADAATALRFIERAKKLVDQFAAMQRRAEAA